MQRDLNRSEHRLRQRAEESLILGFLDFTGAREAHMKMQAAALNYVVVIGLAGCGGQFGDLRRNWR
jgi:hypothetical protein